MPAKVHFPANREDVLAEEQQPHAAATDDAATDDEDDDGCDEAVSGERKKKKRMVVVRCEQCQCHPQAQSPECCRRWMTTKRELNFLCVK